jgi:hypothetical protein
LSQESRVAGVDGSVVAQVRQSLEETRWLLELAQREAAIAVAGWNSGREQDVLRMESIPATETVKLE